MKMCLQCKKEFEAKRDAAKFCSDKCRVKWNRVNGKAQKDDSKLDLLLKEVAELKSKINFTPIAPSSYDAPRAKVFMNDEYRYKEKPRSNIVRSFDYYKQARIDCCSGEEWSELKEEIFAAENLSQKQKILLTT